MPRWAMAPEAERLTRNDFRDFKSMFEDRHSRKRKSRSPGESQEKAGTHPAIGRLAGRSLRGFAGNAVSELILSQTLRIGGSTAGAIVSPTSVAHHAS